MGRTSNPPLRQKKTGVLLTPERMTRPLDWNQHLPDFVSYMLH